MVLDLHAYFQHIAEREDAGEEYPYTLSELVPTVYANRRNAIDAMKRDFLQPIDYTAKARPRANPLDGPPTTDYFLAPSCFEYMVARKSQPVFEIYRQAYHTLRKQTKAQPAPAPYDPAPVAVNAQYTSHVALQQTFTGSNVTNCDEIIVPNLSH